MAMAAAAGRAVRRSGAGGDAPSNSASRAGRRRGGARGAGGGAGGVDPASSVHASLTPSGAGGGGGEGGAGGAPAIIDAVHASAAITNNSLRIWTRNAMAGMARAGTRAHADRSQGPGGPGMRVRKAVRARPRNWGGGGRVEEVRGRCRGGCGGGVADETKACGE